MSKKYMILNNKVNIKDSNGNYLYLHLDKEATKDYFLNYVNKNTVFFHDLKEKLDYMIENKYYDPEFLNKYSFVEGVNGTSVSRKTSKPFNCC